MLSYYEIAIWTAIAGFFVYLVFPRKWMMSKARKKEDEEARQLLIDADRRWHEDFDKRMAESERKNAPPQPGWATHKIELAKQDVIDFGMGYHVLPKGLQMEAIFVEGRFYAYREHEGLRGYNWYTDDQVNVLKIL